MQYNSVSIVLFVAPISLGVLPTYPTNTTSDRIKQADAAHNKASILFKEYSLVDKTLKKLFLGTTKKKYYRVLYNSLIGYANVIITDLIQHLHTSYGNITSTQLADNDVRLLSVYDPNQPV